MNAQIQLQVLVIFCMIVTCKARRPPGRDHGGAAWVEWCTWPPSPSCARALSPASCVQARSSAPDRLQFWVAPWRSWMLILNHYFSTSTSTSLIYHSHLAGCQCTQSACLKTGVCGKLLSVQRIDWETHLLRSLRLSGDIWSCLDVQDPKKLPLGRNVRSCVQSLLNVLAKFWRITDCSEIGWQWLILKLSYNVSKYA